MRAIPVSVRARFSIFVGAICALACAGCSQTEYRLQADQDAYCLIDERNDDPRWYTDDYSIEIDPRSRYFDVYDPDHAPMPSDDPESHEYLHLVGGHNGWAHWHDNGDRGELENPNWREVLGDYMQLTGDGAVKLDIDSSLRLAYVHSPLHQKQLEEMYLSALDVSLQRFNLDTQLFAKFDTAFTHGGALTGNPSSKLKVGRDGTGEGSSVFTKQKFATAGELLVGFANSFVFEFYGGDTNLASSLLNFTVTQPLLRGAGRDIGLESLTAQERELLSNLRAYSQFRQGFYTQVAIGELGVNGPNRNGTSTDLQSFSGQGGNNGFVGLLQQLQQIRNTEDNLDLQERTRDRLVALYDNELIDLVQVDQFNQSIETTRASLLDSENNLKLAMDSFKTGTLGLPPSLPVDLDQMLIEPFQLFPREASPLLNSLFDLQTRIGDVAELFDLLGRGATLQGQLAGLPADGDVDSVGETLESMLFFAESMQRRLLTLNDDLDQFAKAAEQLDPPLTAREQARVLLLRERLEGNPEALKQLFRVMRARLDEIIEELTEENRAGSVEAIVPVLTEMLQVSEACLAVQARTRGIAYEPQAILDDAEQFIEPVRQLFEHARGDLARMDAVVPVREQTMDEQARDQFRRERERLHERMFDLEKGEVGFDVSVERLQLLRDELTPETRVRTLRDLVAWVQSFLQVVERLTLVPAQARLEVITVEPIELESPVAFQIALANRLDFMNGRAALVDRWRQIQVKADALQAVLNISASGDLGTDRDNLVKFRGPKSNLQLKAEFDAPITRLRERNEYRQALIEYQQNRRTLIQSHDELEKGLRALLRTLEQRRLQLGIQRRAVAIAMRRVDETQLSLNEPPVQLQPGQRARISPTTAINLLSAQSSLQTTQNAFLGAWLNFYTARMRLYRELGIMELDSDGHWIETPIDEALQRLPNKPPGYLDQELPPDLPSDLLDGYGAGVPERAPAAEEASVVQTVSNAGKKSLEAVRASISRLTRQPESHNGKEDASATHWHPTTPK